MLRNYILKGLFVSLMLLEAGTLHAREATQKPFWHHHSFHVDAGTMVFLEKHTIKRKKGSGIVWHSSLEAKCFPLPLVDIGWKWTEELGKGFYWQSNLYWSSSHVVLAFLHWSLVPLPGYCFSIGYANNKDILFKLGVGMKEVISPHGILAVDIPLSRHFLLSLETSQLIYSGTSLFEDDDTLLRIEVKLGYKF